MIDIQLDLRSRTPIYTQIVEQIQALLGSGKLEPGEQLPTMRELASQLGVNFNTVARAYRILDESSLISTQHGRGSYILEMPDEAGGNSPHEDALDRLTRRFLAAAEHQGYPEEEIRKRLEQHLTNKE